MSLANELNQIADVAGMDGLAEALGLTQEMLQCAEDGEWERVSRISSQRLLCLNEFFAEPVTSERAAEVEASILNLQSLDRKLSVMCDSEREQLAQKLQDLKNVKKGAAAYQGNS